MGPAELQESLKGRYEILRELGRGGMAIVYLARDLKMNREVAIKVLLPDLALAMGEERFAREIEIAARLSNPHILAVYDSGNADGQLYYVMPLVRGESVRARLDREKQLPVDEALRISIEVAEALDYAHRQGVIHRDIKPENILLEGGHAIVADFGIARAASSVTEGAGLTATGMTLGTPQYMSPEQGAAERNLDGRSDIYSLACVTYEMLAGQPPFTGANTMAIMARQAVEMPPSLTIVRDAIPDEVEETIFQALAKSPVDRFQTAGEFAEALEACLLVAPTVSRRVPQVRTTQATRARRVRRQRRKILMFSAIAVGVIALSLAGLKIISGAGGASRGSPGGLDKSSVAVLYFRDLSADGSLAHIADALTEGLIDELSSVSALQVVSRNGSAEYRGASVPPDSIARALQTGSLIEGDVEMLGKNIRVNVRLLDGNGAAIDRMKPIELPVDSLLAVRSSVVREAAEVLGAALDKEIQLSQSRAGTSVVEAWSQLQRAERLRKDANTHRENGARDSAVAAFAMADSLLRDAERRDPAWADPTVLRGLIAYESAALSPENRRKEPLVQEAIALASRALELKANHPGALALRGRARRHLFQLDLGLDAGARARLLDSAEADLKLATESDGSQAAAYLALSQLYYDKEDNVSALLAAQRAYEADAFLRNQDLNLRQLFWTNYDTERFASAREWCDKGAKRFPANYVFVECQLWLLIIPAAGTPDISSAWLLAGKARSLAPPDTRPFDSHLAQMIVGGALARAGLTDSARNVLKAARAGKDVDPDEELPGYEAIMRVILGEKDEAVRLLKAYVLLHPTHEFNVGTDFHWWWRPLRDHPGFREVAQRRR